jgi:hypothetical protein
MLITLLQGSDQGSPRANEDVVFTGRQNRPQHFGQHAVSDGGRDGAHGQSSQIPFSLFLPFAIRVSLSQTRKKIRDLRIPTSHSLHRCVLRFQNIKLNEESQQIKAAEDLQVLVRHLQEMWLFGPLNTVGESQVQQQTDENAKVVADLLRQLSSMQKQTLEANGDAADEDAM